MSQLSKPTIQAAGSRIGGSVSRAEMARAVIELTKPGITRMAVIAAGVGFAVAATLHNWSAGGLWLTLTACLVGAGFSAAGANTLNQVMEIRRDGCMERTKDRPLPSGRLTLGQAVGAGVIFSLVGIVILWAGANVAAAGVSLVTILSYLLIYTPLKATSPISTIAGAIPGALPPLLGWVAASSAPMYGLDSIAGWSLFLIVFVWQIPHVMAISLKYRDEYAEAGHRVYPVVDVGGHRTGFVAVLWSMTLIPISLLPMWALPQRLGAAYFVTAAVLGVFMLVFSTRMALERSRESAHHLFVVSLVYLPLLLIVMVAEALVGRLG